MEDSAICGSSLSVLMSQRVGSKGSVVLGPSFAKQLVSRSLRPLGKLTGCVWWMADKFLGLLAAEGACRRHPRLELEDVRLCTRPVCALDMVCLGNSLLSLVISETVA